MDDQIWILVSIESYDGGPAYEYDMGTFFSEKEMREAIDTAKEDDDSSDEPIRFKWATYKKVGQDHEE